MRLSREVDVEFPRTQSVFAARRPNPGRTREFVLLGVLGALMTWLFLSWSHIPATEGTLKAKAMDALVGTNIHPQQVSVDGREVTLRGSVPFEGLRSLAAEIVAAIEGVRVVNNELTVANPAAADPKSQ